jgi:hypothetical protein
VAGNNGDVVSATVRRWQLTESLRQMRARTGMTMEEVVGVLKPMPGNKWSRSKLQRIETRDQGIKVKDVEQLLDAYGSTDESLRAWLLDLAGTAHERGYWLAIRKDVPEDFRPVLEVEAALVAQRQFENTIVPGLLQTPDYARAIMSGGSPGLDGEIIERRVLARMARQQVLTKSSPLRLYAIIDEAVLERPVGGHAVMRGQLRRLLDEAGSDNITLQVVPKSIGAHPGMDGSIMILTLPEPIPDFGYSEGPGRAVYIEDREAVRDYTLRFGILTDQALSPSASVELITEALQGYQ